MRASDMGARILVVDDSPTLRKVVTTILERRQFDVLTAEDGQDALEKLAGEGAPAVDLVLLDFVMPRMNGYQFCRELRASEALRHLPVVLMSAKGDKIRGQFVQQTGAIDAITKPFDARALVAVVESALDKQRSGRARPLPDAAQMPEEEDSPVVESLRPSGLPLSSDPGLRRVQVAGEFAAALGRVLAPALLEQPALAGATEHTITEAFTRAVTPEAMAGISTLVRSLDFGEDSQEVLSGDVSVISIAEVLQMLQLQRQSGALAVTRRSSEITVYVKSGHIQYVSAKGLSQNFLLGRYLVEDGALTREELAVVLTQRSGSRRLLGEQLIQLGHCDEAQVGRALVRQTSELIYEVVRWQQGRFSLTSGASCPEADKAALDLPSSGLVMEGFRRVDEWRLIEDSVDFDEVLYRDAVAAEQLAGESQLTRLEREVLTRIDGERTVREVVDEVSGSSFEVCKVVYQFLNSRLVRRKSS